MNPKTAPSRTAVALLVLAAQLFGYAHLALVLHVICPVHGELIDARTPVPAAIHHEAPVDSLVTRLQAASDESLCAGEEDTCVVAVLMRTSVVLQSPPALPSAGVAPQLAVVDEGVDRAPARHLLLLAAPKASPPA